MDSRAQRATTDATVKLARYKNHETDEKRLSDLLTWLRANDYVATSVTVGDVSVVVQDLGAVKAAQARRPDEIDEEGLTVEERWAKDFGMPPRPGSEMTNDGDVEPDAG